MAESTAGGSIDASGVYTPPASAGVYHVVATSAADPAQVGAATVTVTVAPPTGPQLYVATTGNDANAGTIDAPWRTIQKAMNAARPGDTVNITAGTYTERLTLNVSGTSGAPIVFQNNRFAPPAAQTYGSGAQGDSVIIDYASLGTVSDGVPFLEVNAKSNVTIQGITFQNYNTSGYGRGLRVEGASSNINFRYLKFFNLINTSQTPPTYNTSSSLEATRVMGPATNVNFYSCEWGNSRTTTSEVLTYEGSTQSTVQWSYIHECDQIAFHAYNGANHITFVDNLAHHAGMTSGGAPVYNGLTGLAYYMDGAQFTTVDRCIGRYGGVGYQTLAEPNIPQAHDNVVRNSLFYNNTNSNGSPGIQVGTWYGDPGPYNIEVVNNTIYGNTVGAQIGPTAGGVVWKNNIVAQNGSQVAYMPGGSAASWGVEDHNDFVGGGGPGLGAHDITGNPLFTNPSAGDFSLQPGSPAIDAGDPALTTAVLGGVDAAGNPRIVGNAADLGAYE